MRHTLIMLWRTLMWRHSGFPIGVRFWMALQKAVPFEYQYYYVLEAWKRYCLETERSLTSDMTVQEFLDELHRDV